MHFEVDVNSYNLLSGVFYSAAAAAAAAVRNYCARFFNQPIYWIGEQRVFAFLCSFITIILLFFQFSLKPNCFAFPIELNLHTVNKTHIYTAVCSTFISLCSQIIINFH